jgi:chromosome segregation ATPase
MRWTLLLCALFVFPACGKEESSGSGNEAEANKPAEPDPAELERKRQQAAAAAAQKKAALEEEKTKLINEIAELETKRKSMVAAHEAEAAGLPEKSKLRRIVSGLIRDSVSKRSIYETNQKRIDALEKEVRDSATGEIKELKKQIAKKDKEYNDILSGAKAERVNADLGIAAETQVQKEIRTLREAKQEWFTATRDTRRGKASAKSQAASKFKGWFQTDELRKAVVAKALPKGKTADSYDFSELDFYLYLELLEDTLERLNVAEEKEVLSENDKKLVAIEKVLDELNDSLAEKMTAGGGALEEYTELTKNIGDDKETAEGLERQLEQMREAFLEADKAIERHETEEYELDQALEAKQKRLKAVRKQLR